MFLATGLNFPDALGAGPQAFQGHPIVLTDPTTLSPEAASTLSDVDADLAIILGGPGAVSQAVQDTVEQSGVETLRVAGTNRFETAAALATTLVGLGELDSTNVGLASGLNFPDALSAAPYLGNPTGPAGARHQHGGSCRDAVVPGGPGNDDGYAARLRWPRGHSAQRRPGCPGCGRRRRDHRCDQPERRRPRRPASSSRSSSASRWTPGRRENPAQLHAEQRGSDPRRSRWCRHRLRGRHADGDHPACQPARSGRCHRASPRTRSRPETAARGLRAARVVHRGGRHDGTDAEHRGAGQHQHHHVVLRRARHVGPAAGGRPDHDPRLPGPAPTVGPPTQVDPLGTEWEVSVSGPLQAGDIITVKAQVFRDLAAPQDSRPTAQPSCRRRHSRSRPTPRLRP